MIYCYARVSTTEQKLDRQLAEFKPYEPYQLYCDKMSGKDFNRKQYQKMRKKLKSGDTLIILSLDRLGRNYDLIKQEWSYLVNKGVLIKVLDMPLIDTTNNNLISKFISDLVVQLLSFVAQMERDKIKERQAQGIAQAKLRGVHLGRPKTTLPDNFDEVARKYKDREITFDEAIELTKLSRATFFKYAKEKGCLRSINYEEN